MFKRTNRVMFYSGLILLVVGVATVGGVVYSNYRYGPDAIERYNDRSHDHKIIDSTNARLDVAMAASYKTLAPRLAAFGIRLPQPGKSSCIEGDPSLYKYSCFASVDIDSSAENQALSSGEDAAQKLAQFNTLMLADGWKIGGNDFRSQQPQSESQIAATLSAYPVFIAYNTTDCDLQFGINLPNQPKSGITGSLTCAADILPGFYY